MNYKVYLTSSEKARGLRVTKTACILVIEPEDFTKNQVIELKRKGYTVLGYLNIGSVEDTRPYFKELKPYLLKDKNGNPIRLDDWEHEYFLDLRKTKVRDFCVKRASEIKAMRCDGYWLDNIDVFEEKESSAMLEAITSTIKRIKGLNGYVMLNGGMTYLEKVFDEEAKGGLYKVQCGAFKIYENAEETKNMLLRRKIDATIVSDHDIHRVQCGAFSEFSNAFKLRKEIVKLIPSMSPFIRLVGGNSSVIPISKYVDGVTQEEVVTRIDNYSGKGKFGLQTAKQSEEYLNHMSRVRVHGLQTFLLEYTRESSVARKVKDTCFLYNFTGYYCASDVNL